MSASNGKNQFKYLITKSMVYPDGKILACCVACKKESIISQFYISESYSSNPRFWASLDCCDANINQGSTLNNCRFRSAA